MGSAGCAEAELAQRGCHCCHSEDSEERGAQGWQGRALLRGAQGEDEG